MEKNINLNKKDYSGIERFAMVKVMHKKSLENEIAEKKEYLKIHDGSSAPDTYPYSHILSPCLPNRGNYPNKFLHNQLHKTLVCQAHIFS